MNYTPAMNSQPIRPMLASAVILAILSGCGGGGSSSVGVAPASSQSGPSANAGPQQTVPLFGQIVIENVLERSIPATIDFLVFRGLDSSGLVVYGPEARPKAGRIVLERVPLTIRQLQIEYFQGEILRGRGQTPVTLASGQEIVLTSPAFADIVYPLTGVAVRPGALTLKRGEVRPLELEGTYGDQTTRDLARLAQWTAWPEGIVEISPEGELRALQVGQCQVTAQLDNFSSLLNVQVERPELVGLQLSLGAHTLVEGQTHRLEVIGLYEDGVQEVPPHVSWSSEEPEIASVTQAGLVEALRLGQTRILAQSGSQLASLNLSVAQDLNIQELFSDPADLQIPKGFDAEVRLFGRYRNGTEVELTSLASWSSSDSAIAKVAGVNTLYPFLQPPDYSGGALRPRPFFPSSDNVIGGAGQGEATVTAEYEGQSVEIPVQVSQPIPLYAKVVPALTQLLTQGQSAQLQSECVLSDASVVTDHPQVTIESLGSAVQLSGSNLATAQSPGSSLFRAVLPAPNLPNIGPARFIYRAFPFNPSPDYFRYPFDLAGIVVSRALQISFSSSALNHLQGSILAESAAGIFWAEADRIGLGVTGWVPIILRLPMTSSVHSLGAGNFSGTGSQSEVFFAGRRAENGVDYGVILSHTPERRVFGTSPPRVQIIPAETVYREFSDTPHGVVRAITGDFDGNGRQDAAIFYRPTENDQQLRLKVRLSDQGALDLERPEISTPSVQAVATGDVNGDGHLDLVGLNPQNVLVWLNDGQGNFSLTTQIALGLGAEDRVAQLNLGDVDGDGRLDACFFRSQGYGWRDYFLYYGDGSGDFVRSFQGSSGYRVQASRLADFTGDGKADLITLQSDSIHTLNHSDPSQRRASLSIHPGSSDGFLPQQVTPISSDSSPTSLLLRDQNGDGHPDIVASLQYPSTERPFNTNSSGWVIPGSGYTSSFVYQHYRGLQLLRVP